MINYEENWECKAEEQKEEGIPLVVDGREYAELKSKCEELEKRLAEQSKLFKEYREYAYKEVMVEIRKRNKLERGIIKVLEVIGSDRYEEYKDEFEVMEEGKRNV